MKSNFNRSFTEDAWFKKIIESAAEAILCLNEKFQIVYCNPLAEDQLNCTNLQKKKQAFTSLIANKEDESLFQQKLSELQTIKDRRLLKPFRLLLKSPSGGKFWAETSASLLNFKQENFFVLMIRSGDYLSPSIPDELENEHLEALGRLARNMASDFSNITHVIKGYAEMMFHQMQERDPYFKQVEAIFKAAEYAEDLTRQLLIFGHHEEFAQQDVHLEQLYFGLKNLVLKMLGSNIKLFETIDAGLWKVTGDPEKLKQVILNLILNACQAMPQGGELHVILKNQKLSAAEKKQLKIDSESDDFVLLQISDTGKGMSEKVRRKALEPYFTTDETGKKSGLGLSVVYGIVKAMKGVVKVESQAGKGSTFTLYFPATHQEKKDDKKMKTVGGKETILVVEDVPEVQLLLVELLQTVGYKAIGTSNYQEAMEYYNQHALEIDMIISDVILPDNYGTELIRKILEQRPDLKYLLISGYAEQLDIEQNISLFKGHFLQKPFQPSVFLKMVRQMLDKD